MSEITLKIPIGDALDRLSILKIKLIKIEEEEKRCEVLKELTLIENLLQEYERKYEFHFKILYKINQSIWNKLDEFKKLEHNNKNLSPNEKTKLILKQNQLFKDITNENDDRYRVKNKINILCNSNLKEQKGYKLKHAFVLSHLGLGDNICMIGLVRYLATKYDKVKVVCKTCNQQNVQLIYADDPDIELYLVQDDCDISVPFEFDIKKFKKITENYDTYIAGHHIFDSKHNAYYPPDGAWRVYTDLPFNFYDDMKIDRNIFWDYYHISSEEMNDKDLYKLLFNEEINYIFIHSSSSIGQIFTLKDAEEYFNFSCNDILVINPCENVYKKDHKFYDIAEKFINHSLFYYKTLIEKASKIIMSDSSFFCFSICLKTDAEFIYIKPRDPTNYNLNNLNKINKYIYWP